MKNIKKLLAIVAVFALVLAGVVTLIACTETHVCGHVCETCQKCTDANCKDPVCAEKCPGHTPAAHVCGHKCPTCGKCTDTTCTDAACKSKCPGHTPAPAHTCGHVCETCGKCTDATCNNAVCAEKCEGHDEPTPEHVCGHVCETCGKCTDATCNNAACAEKCEGHDEPTPEHVCGHVCETCGKCTDATCDNEACAEKCEGHGPIKSWWVPENAEKQPDVEGNLISIKIITSPVSFSCATAYEANADHAYIAVKYSGTATFHEISIYGTKDGGAAKSGVVAAVAGNGWNVSKNIGSDFSIVVAQIGGYYGAGELDIDTITNISFTVTGDADDTFILHGIELLPNANHNFGTPTPPVVEGELTIGDMVATENAESPNPLSVSKNEGEQTVSFSAAPGWNTVTAQVTNYTSDYKYLVLEFTTNDKITMSVRAGNDTYLTTPWTQEVFVSGKNIRVVDLTNQTLQAEFQLVFCFNANENPGSDYSAETPKTVVFSNISFSETDPTASDEANHFRTPTGSNLTYSASDNKISYTNTRTDYYRYVEILLENHDTDYDVLSIKITGYNGLVMGVRVLYNDDIEGEITAATKDVIASSAYYSEIKTDALTEILIYLAADKLDGLQVTGVQLYLDAPAAAGKDGDVEITLNSIEMLKSSELNLKNSVITAQNATITVGETADFQVTLKDAEGNDINGTVVYEYRAAGTTGNYTAGLPTVAGEYEVRFYYMGSREYNYSRTTTATLTVTGSSEIEDPEPTKPVVIGDMVNDSNNAYTIVKNDDDSQTVSYDSYRGTANTIVNVQDWSSANKYLVIELEANGTCTVGVSTTAAAWPDVSGDYKSIAANTRTTLVFDMTGKNFSETEASLYFIYNNSIGWGTALEEGAATTITFYSISFSATNPTAAD